MRLTEESKELLLSMDWLGNVRELQNLMECIVQLYPGDLILPQYILENTVGYVRSCDRVQMRPANGQEQAMPEPLPQPERPQALTREEVQNALHICGNNRTNAAKYLGISRRTLYRKLEEFGFI